MINFRSKNGSETVLALGLVVLGVLFRVLPHPENVTPTTAIALFAGVTLAPALAFTVPLVVMIASDLVIGPHPLFWLVYLSFMIVTAIGQFIRQKNGALPVLGATLGGSVLFFVLTNLGVFLFEKMYPLTWQGLAECFTMALPFFRNSVIADVFYCFVLFAVFELARRRLSVPVRN